MSQVHTTFAGEEPIDRGPKDDCWPVFYTEAVKNNFKSEETGHPVYEEQEFVRVMVPGDKLVCPVFPIAEEHKRRWPRHYEAWKRGEEHVEGTPIENLPRIEKPHLAMLRDLGVRSIEQLANLPDSSMGPMGMHELRQRAKAYVALMRDPDQLLARISQLEASNAETVVEAPGEAPRRLRSAPNA